MDQSKARHSEKERYNEYIKDLFNGPIWEQRALAASHLGNLKDSRATNVLVKALKSERDPGVINRIIEALGKIRDAKATIPILDILREEMKKEAPNKSFLFIIIESLLKIGDKRALTDLGILKNSCDADIKKLSEEALNCLDPNWQGNINKIKK